MGVLWERWHAVVAFIHCVKCAAIEMPCSASVSVSVVVPAVVNRVAGIALRAS
jgi:hypothetical protein